MNEEDLELPLLFSFELSAFIKFYPEPVNENDLLRVITSWSYLPGGLAERNIEHFFLANPIWTRPLIQVGERTFFWPLVEIFQSFGLEMIEGLLEGYDDLKKCYRDAVRAKYLEEQVEKMVKDAFPFGKCYVGAKWRKAGDSVQYENDVIAIFDGILFIAECKSGRISQSARRGSVERLSKEIEKLLQDASEQSERLSKHIYESTESLHFECRNGKNFDLNPKEIIRVVRLNVTLDFWGPLACAIRSLVRARLIDSKIATAPTIALTDLENVFDLLEGPLPKLHYLSRRLEFERRVDLNADEMDLLAFYLDNGFNIGEREFESDKGFMIYGISSQIESYFFGKSIGHSVTKPKLKFTNWWKELLNAIEDHKSPLWTHIGMRLLSVRHEDQKKFEVITKKMLRNVRSHWHEPDHENIAILHNGPPQRRNVIFSCGFKNKKREEALDFYKIAFRTVEDSSDGNKDILGIALAANWGKGPPYVFIGLALPERNAMTFALNIETN